MPETAREWHVASLVVRHQREAIPALAAAVAGADGLELALQEEHCSVLLQESDGTRGLMASIDLLQALPGVITVNLVYHHVERPEPEECQG
ncbi:chaperone NapD [Luteimonas arsenica]|uniref:chaperone NapD n=1 Tax=Luteimonas arsenica TaxID=1586242 RepID=UPI0014042EA3|nr:chaperone NapD [Luteimonas arsenica]